MGVRAFFFFPARVAAFTRADEFHSVRNTRWPAALSHLARSAICVVFPDPSTPSTTNSLPGYSCGLVSVFSMGCRSADLEPDRFAEHPLERDHVPVRGPQFELRIACRAQLDQCVLPAVLQFDRRERLRVAPIQAL